MLKFGESCKNYIYDTIFIKFPYGFDWLCEVEAKVEISDVRMTLWSHPISMKIMVCVLNL